MFVDAYDLEEGNEHIKQNFYAEMMEMEVLALPERDGIMGTWSIDQMGSWTCLNELIICGNLIAM